MIRMVLQILMRSVTPASMIHLKLFIPSGTTSCWYLLYCSSLLVSAVSSFCSFLRLWLLLLGGRIGQNDLRYLKSPKVYTNHPVVPAQTLMKWTPIRIVSCAAIKFIYSFSTNTSVTHKQPVPMVTQTAWGSIDGCEDQDDRPCIVWIPGCLCWQLHKKQTKGEVQSVQKRTIWIMAAT